MNYKTKIPFNSKAFFKPITLLVFLFVYSYFNNGTSSFISSTNNEINENLYPKTPLNTSLYEAKIKMDSIEKNEAARRDFTDCKQTSKLQIHIVGIAEMPKYFTTNYIETNLVSYFISFSGFKLKPNKSLNYNGDSTIISTINNKESEKAIINFRFSKEKEAILIPVSKTASYIFKVFFWIVFLALIIVIVAVYFITPLSILSSITNGTIFKTNNYDILLLAAKAIFAITLFFFVVQIIAYLFVYNKIHNHFSFNLYEITQNLTTPLITSLIYYILSIAIKNGAQLQKEKELTI